MYVSTIQLFNNNNLIVHLRPGNTKWDQYKGITGRLCGSDFQPFFIYLRIFFSQTS